MIETVLLYSLCLYFYFNQVLWFYEFCHYVCCTLTVKFQMY